MQKIATEVCFSELDFNSECVCVAFKIKSIDEYFSLRKDAAIKEEYLYAQKVLTTPVMFAGSQFSNEFLQRVFTQAKAHIKASCAYKINSENCNIRLVFMQRQISKARPVFVF